MENFKLIEFHHTRDFSRKMNATFEFIRQNFKALSKSILFIAGPPVLVVGLLIGSFIGEFIGMSQASMGAPGSVEAVQRYFMSVTFWLQIAMMLVFLLISSVMTLATINNYLILYEEQRTNKIEVQAVWERVRSTFWMYLGTMFFFFLLGIGVYLLLLIPFALLAALSPFLIFFGVLFFMCGLIYLFFSVSLTFFIRGYEKLGFFDAIGRSYRLVQGKWWSTFGLIFILYLIMGFASYIFMIPMYVMSVITALTTVETGVRQDPSTAIQVIMTISLTLYYLAQMLLNSLPNIGIAFQYFNLVELKESKGLLSQIEQIGQDQAPAAPTDEHY